jgi:Raf kinase inhibitor-like YbhB/YbcL family protein
LSFKLTSSAFKEGETIPSKYGYNGDNVSPPLTWSEVPPKTASFAIITDDPDAPAKIWVHWVIFNIPAPLTHLNENIPRTSTISGIGVQGSNDFQNIGYGGPVPPRGQTHHYFIKLYALDSLLDLRAGATKTEVEKAMKGHILAQTQLTGIFSR